MPMLSVGFLGNRFAGFQKSRDGSIAAANKGRSVVVVPARSQAFVWLSVQLSASELSRVSRVLRSQNRHVRARTSTKIKTSCHSSFKLSN